MTEQVFLQTTDYVVVGLMLLIPLGIGLLFAVKDAKKATRDEYLLGGRQMGLVPVTLSLFATYVSAISLMGAVTDIYTYGAMFATLHLGFAVSYIVGYFTIVPLVYPLHLTSVYEYLSLRFDSELVRMSAVTIGSLQTICYMAIALLTPALGLQAAAGIPLWMSVAIVGVIGTIYTAVGGIKSVVWTDAFQSLIMYAGVSIIIIKGMMFVGGADVAWEIAQAGGRTSFKDFNPDPRARHTWWGTIIGGMFMWFVNAFNQSTIQRLCAMKTLKDAKRSYLINIPIHTSYGTLLFLCGISIYAYFAYLRCDPFEAGLITNRNQLPPYFVLYALRDTPGVAGFYMSALFSGALSTLSSGINSLAANTVEDFLRRPLRKVKENTATLITKLIVVLYGILIVGLAYAANSLKGPLTQMGLSIFGACGGPVLGIFLLGASVPWGNKYGAFLGGIIALAINIWIAVCGQLFGKKHVLLAPPPTDMCFLNESTPEELKLGYSLYNESYQVNTTFTSNLLTASNDDKNPYVFGFFLYDISYEWYGFIGALVSFIVGTIISYFTRGYIKSSVNPKLIFPILRKPWSLSEPPHIGADESNIEANENLKISKLKIEEFEHIIMSVEVEGAETNVTSQHCAKSRLL